MLPTPPIQLKRSVEWLNVVLGGAVEATYEGTKSPGGNLDEVWHEVTTTGDWIIPAEEQHLRAHRSEQLDLLSWDDTEWIGGDYEVWPRGEQLSACLNFPHSMVLSWLFYVRCGL